MSNPQENREYKNLARRVFVAARVHVAMAIMLLLGAVRIAWGAEAFDPVAMDPPPAVPPAENPQVDFESGGARLNSVVYLAAGAGPHPSAVLLHGYPGNQSLLDLAEVMRRAGWNTFLVHYRGAWGSGGQYSFVNALEDVAAVVATLRDEGFARAHRVDRRRIALVGHSLGGTLALVSGAELDSVACVAAFAPSNLGSGARALSIDPVAAAREAQRLEAWMPGRIHSATGEALVAEAIVHAQRFDIEAHAETLMALPVLLVAATRDEVVPMASNHDPMVAALRKGRANRLVTVTLDTDHSFAGARVALARALLAWLPDACVPHPPSVAGKVD